MSDNQPKIAYSKLKSPPPLNNIQFYDGYVPALPADTYNINVTYTLTPPTTSDVTPPSYTRSQQFTVQGPEFTIDPAVISTVYPPQGGNNQYDQDLPFIVLNDPSLPWERSLVPGDEQQGSGMPLPWMALLVLTKDEIIIPNGGENPVTTTTVKNLLASDPNVHKPTLPAKWVSGDLENSQCQTITITGAAFNAIVPTQDDLAYLAHCRAINTADEGGQLLSVILGNRLAVAQQTPVRYYAHLVSLEGFADYLGPKGKAIPPKSGSSNLKDVQLASLFNWTFVSQPETGLSFEALIQGLITSEQATGGALSLPIPAGSNPPAEVQSRLNNGYAPLTFYAGAGDQGFAWYRGPFSAVVPQTLPNVGSQQVPVLQATSADALMIYSEQQGLFDLSYTNAWNFGRSLALSDTTFAQTLCAWRKAAHSTAAYLAQRLSMSHLAGKSLDQLTAPDVSRRQFASLMGNGLGKKLSAAMTSSNSGGSVDKAVVPQTASVNPKNVPGMEGAASALADSTAELCDAVASWLARLRRLLLLPFSCLVPDPRMLPVESVRFFYVDPDWIDALTAGALSIGIHGSADVNIQKTLLPTLMKAVQNKEQELYSRVYSNAAASTGKRSGILIRSQLVSAWPKLVIKATSGGAPVNIIRDDCLAPNVRLCLFDGVPDTVSLAQPYHGLLFGIEDNGIALRNLTTAGQIGVQITSISPVTPSYRDSSSGVLDVEATAQALAKALSVAAIGSGDFALQMVKAPEIQSFQTRRN